MRKYSPHPAITIVEAFEVNGPSFSGLVYTQGIADQKASEGNTVRTYTIVRYRDGSMDYFPGETFDSVATKFHVE